MHEHGTPPGPRRVDSGPAAVSLVDNASEGSEGNTALKRFPIRLMIVLVVIVAAIVYCIPTFAPEVWPHKKINLGLDLQGGMHLVLEVNTEKVIEAAVERNYQELRELVRKNQIASLSAERPTPYRIAVKVQGRENIEKFKALMDKELRDLQIQRWSDDPESYSATLDLPDAETANIRKLSVEQALETIRNRVDQFGVSEPDIRRQGENRILVQLPGIQDTQRAKDLIGRTALLEFKLVDEAHDVNAAVQGSPPPAARSSTRSTRTAPPGAAPEPPSCLKRGRCSPAPRSRTLAWRWTRSTGSPTFRSNSTARARAPSSASPVRTSANAWRSSSTTRSTPRPRSRRRSRAARPASPAGSPWRRRATWPSFCGPAPCPPRSPSWKSARSAPRSARTPSAWA